MDKSDLLLSSYDFELPDELIAQRPVEPRDHSRLLVYRVGEDRVEHKHFYELPELLPEKSHLVFNQSKVFPCRLKGQKESGSKFEIFFLNINPNPFYNVLIRSNKTKKINDQFKIGPLVLTVVEINNDSTFSVSLNVSQEEFINYLDANALLPIPPYIRNGESDQKDKNDYQTTYAQELGSVAAPTAGLHFSTKTFQDLEQRKISNTKITLHVGMGTFKPVTSESILDHQMHSEFYKISQEAAIQLNKHKGHLIAVGTTSLRVLESNFLNNEFTETVGSTNIFLHPGKEIKSINGLLTNFHLPKSSLIMLVSSIIGRKKTLELYHQAIQEKYRFFSYGDAMLILR